MGIVAGVARIELQGRDDGKAFDEAGVVGRRKILDERVGQQEVAGEVFVEASGIDLQVAAEDGVDLFKVRLDDADPG